MDVKCQLKGYHQTLESLELVLLDMRKKNNLPVLETATQPTTTRSTFALESNPTGTLKSFTPCKNYTQFTKKICNS